MRLPVPAGVSFEPFAQGPEEALAAGFQLLQLAVIQPNAVTAGANIHGDRFQHRLLQFRAALRTAQVVQLFQPLLFFFREGPGFLGLRLETPLDFELLKILFLVLTRFDRHRKPPSSDQLAEAERWAYCSRSGRVASTTTRSFSRASSTVRVFNPQSGSTQTCSGESTSSACSSRFSTVATSS